MKTMKKKKKNVDDDELHQLWPQWLATAAKESRKS